MRKFIQALAITSVLTSGALTSAAWAADKPAIGPAPAWVRPVALPAASAKADPNVDGQPVRILLSDQQVSLEPGRQTVYSEVAIRIGTPQGLAAGNISLPWRPDTDALTVHKLRILRGTETVDVLKSGQQFTVARREPNMESAMLDGVLTANIQPEGLQVGDVLEFAVSVMSSDPTLKNHVEQIGAAWNVAPIARAHWRVQWPRSVDARVRTTAALPAAKPVRTGDLTSVELMIDEVKPYTPPKGAPRRYAVGRLAEVTDFQSWADLAALMAPLYAKAATLPADGPLRVELQRIAGLSSDPKVRTEAALALVQDRVRYVALAMGAGGLVPADASETWARRYGDCKGKTALLIALLRELGVQPEPVVVSTMFGDGMDQRSPMIGLFDHVLVRATIAGRTYWLDGTRTGDTSLDRIVTPGFGWGLPLIVSGAALVRMMPAPLETPTQVTTIRIDASGGLTVPAPATVEMLFRGDEAVAMKLGLANLAGEARDRALREYWRGQYDFIDAKTVDAAFDAKTGEQRLTMSGLARMSWKDGWYETDGTGLAYKADFSREPGPDRDAPFAVAYPFYNKAVETITLPPGFDRTSAGTKADIDRTVAGVAYHRRATLSGNVFSIEKTERSVAPEFASRDSAAAQASLREMADATVYLRRPDAYRQTAVEVAAAMTATPTTAQGFLDRGVMLNDQSRYDEAIADLDRAAALDPKNAWALANRGLVRVWKQDFAGAARDLNAAAAIDPRNVVVFRARGLLAQREGRNKDAVAAYTTALEIEPGSSFAVGHRAEADHAAGDDEAALRDSAAALKLAPGWPELYLMRANIHRNAGRREDAMAEMRTMLTANPASSYALVSAARMYAALGDRTQAMTAYDRALAIKPEAYIYINRARSRSRADLSGRRADIETALKLEPSSDDALVAKADVQADTGDLAGAATTYTVALKSMPDDVALLTGRGRAFARAGDATRAKRDFGAAEAHATTPAALTDLCWGKAVAGFALDTALANCDAALAALPDNAGVLDARGLVLLRLGRLDDAIANYDRTLARFPNMPPSLFGRGVARARKGDKAKADADMAAALKIDADVRATFEGYGVTP